MFKQNFSDSPRLLRASSGARNYPSFQKFMVGGCKVWPVSQADEAWAEDNSLAG